MRASWFGLRGRLLVAMGVVAVVSSALCLPLGIVYFERRLSDLPPDVDAAVQNQLRLSGGDFDGFAELALGLVVALALSLILASWLSRRISQPVVAVAAAARQVAAGEGVARVAVRPSVRRSRDEVGQLVSDFEAMATTLATLEAERRTTSASIAHELRTPVTAMTVRLHALADGVLTFDRAEARRLLAQADLLSRLVEDLRTSTLGEAGELVLQCEEVDVSALAAGCVQDFRPLAEPRGVELRLASGSEGCRVQADPQRVRQALGNLLDNAIRHTPRGGRVTVSVSADVAGVTLAVSDTGPGIAAAEQERVVQPFVRGADSPGSGLGLSVAAALARAHGGHIRIDRGAAGGAVVQLLLASPAELGDDDLATE